MFPYKHYVPILKGKEAEFSSLSRTSQPNTQLLTPLIEIINFTPLRLTPAQRAKRRKALPTLSTHVQKEIDSIVKCWRGKGPIFIDLHLIPIAVLYSIAGGYPAFIFNSLHNQGVSAIPVIYTDSDARIFTDYIAVNNSFDTGVAIRLRPVEMVAGQFLQRTQSKLNIPEDKVDLILDYQSIIGENIETLASSAQIFTNNVLINPNSWRTLIVASGAFPVDLREFDALSQNDLDRNDWLFWLKLLSLPLNRKPSFGDYGIAHPDLVELDIVPDVSASIRYTCEQKWKIMRGQGTFRRGWEQIRDRCNELILLPEYDGSAFSWGDKYIEDCANSVVGTGNALIWRTVANNRHFEKTCSVISSLP